MNRQFKAVIVLVGILFLILGVSSYKRLSAQDCTPMMGIISQLDPTEVQVYQVPPGHGFNILLTVVDNMFDTPDNHATVQTMREKAVRGYVVFQAKNGPAANVTVLWGDTGECTLMVSTLSQSLFLSTMAELRKTHPEQFEPSAPKKDI